MSTARHGTASGASVKAAAHALDGIGGRGVHHQSGTPEARRGSPCRGHGRRFCNLASAPPAARPLSLGRGDCARGFGLANLLPSRPTRQGKRARDSGRHCRGSLWPLGFPFPGTDGWALVPFRSVACPALPCRALILHCVVCVKPPPSSLFRPPPLFSRCPGCTPGGPGFCPCPCCRSPHHHLQVLPAYYEPPLHLSSCTHDCFLFSACTGRFYMVIQPFSALTMFLLLLLLIQFRS